MRPLISKDEKVIKKVLPKIVKEGWTARKVERYFAMTKPKSSSAAIKSIQQKKLEDSLSAKYDAVVRINNHSLTFKCRTDSDLEKLVNRLKRAA